MDGAKWPVSADIAGEQLVPGRGTSLPSGPDMARTSNLSGDPMVGLRLPGSSIQLLESRPRPAKAWRRCGDGVRAKRKLNRLKESVNWEAGIRAELGERSEPSEA